MTSQSRWTFLSNHATVHEVRPETMLRRQEARHLSAGALQVVGVARPSPVLQAAWSEHLVVV